MDGRKVSLKIFFILSILKNFAAYFEDSGSPACAKIEDPTAGLTARHCGEVAPRQVHHVHEIPLAAAVPRVPVVTEEPQARPGPAAGRRHAREQVGGRAARVLAQQAARVGAGWVEVPENGHTPAGIRPAPVN